MELELSGSATFPVVFKDLVDQARDFGKASRSPATLRAYESDWKHFTAWCDRNGVKAIPADPAVVALYITELARTHRPATITRRVATISIEHQRRGLESPTRDGRFRDILRGIRRTAGTAQQEATPLVIGDLRQVIAHLPKTLAGVRDRALLLVGFAGALRRSELVALDAEDLEKRPEGFVVHIRRSKTDPEGRGRIVALPMGKDRHTCPVRALNKWAEAAGIENGPVFRSINRHGGVGGRLSDRAVSLIIKARVEAAGLDATGFSGHSLRAGFATTAAANGASERAIANQTGHRSMEVLRRYVRAGTVFSDNAVTAVGL